MKKLMLGACFALAVAPAPAAAINWQGHEDWLQDQPHARELRRELQGRAPPQPQRRPNEPACQRREDVGKVPDNPYEPVPLLCTERPKPQQGN